MTKELMEVEMRNTQQEQFGFRAKVTLLTQAFPLLMVVMLSVLSAMQEAGAGRPEAQEETTVEIPERIKQRYQWLFKPDFAKLELARMLPKLNDGPEKLTAPFRVGNKITFRLLITNALKENKALLIASTYKHNRPQLYKDSEYAPYRKDTEELIRTTDTFRYEDTRFEPIKSGQTITEIIDLGEWYEPLQPGEYKLIVRHRFIWGGEWLESLPITFKVIL